MHSYTHKNTYSYAHTHTTKGLELNGPFSNKIISIRVYTYKIISIRVYTYSKGLELNGRVKSLPQLLARLSKNLVDARQEFSKVTSLPNSLYNIDIQLTFENFCYGRVKSLPQLLPRMRQNNVGGR